MEILADDVDIPAPDFDEWLLPAWRCWWRLHLERPWFGGGLGPMLPGRIPWRDVLAWCEFHDMSGDDCLFTDELVRRMDTAYHAWYAEHRPKS